MRVDKANIKKVLFGKDIFDSHKSNNWSLIRLMASVAVIYGHSFVLSPKSGHEDFTIRYLTRGVTYSGQMAVVIFFFLSGALITRSALLSSSWAEYCLKRVLRIFPGLLLCLAFTVLVIFPAFGNSVSYKDGLRYFLVNIGNQTNVFFVDGIFANNPTPSVNGALWTIPNELRLYLFILLATCFCAKRKDSLLAIFVVTLFFLWKLPNDLPLIGSNQFTYGHPSYVLNSIFFILGSIVSITKVSYFKKHIWLIMGILTLCFWKLHPNHHIIFFISLISFCVFVSQLQILRRFGLKGDYSYGVYLYGWPSSQLVFSFFGNLAPELNFLLATLLSLLFAYFSWNMVERTSLNLFRHKKSAQI